jgi:hypothetical protein
MIAILQGQWAPPTVLGFAVIGGGLILGALNPVPETDTDEARAQQTPEVASPIFAEPSHAALPVPSDRRPPIVVRTIQK